MKFKILIAIFIVIATNAFAETINVPEINGVIHDFNKFGSNFNLQLKIRCLARKFTFGPPITSCGEKVFNAKISKVGDKLTYRFEKSKFKYQVGTFHVFDSIRMALYINDYSLSTYDDGSQIILKQFIQEKTVDWPSLQRHISELSLYAFKPSVIELSLINEESAIPYLKDHYNKMDTLRIGMRYQLLEPRVENNRYNERSYRLHEEGRYYAGHSIDDEMILSSKIWLFTGIVNSIKLKFTSQVVRVVNGTDPAPQFDLRNIESEFVYPSSSPSPIYPEYLQKITVDESWVR